jgi:nuclear receptor subfamily 1 group I
LTTFSDRWRNNENVMLILSAITLFCPDQVNLKEVEKIRSKQERYYVLLKRLQGVFLSSQLPVHRYLDTQCSPTEAQQSYDHLLRKLIDLHQLNQGLLRIYCGLNPNEVDPLLLELFDLKRTLGT